MVLTTTTRKETDMTATTIRVLHCDFADCDQHTTNDQADGWTNAATTHGCPTHGETIEAHKANVTSTTRGRGYREKTTWFLTCACGWRPQPNFTVHTFRWLEQQHLAHVKAVTAAAA